MHTLIWLYVSNNFWTPCTITPLSLSRRQAQEEPGRVHFYSLPNAIRSASQLAARWCHSLAKMPRAPHRIAPAHATKDLSTTYVPVHRQYVYSLGALGAFLGRLRHLRVASDCTYGAACQHQIVYGKTLAVPGCVLSAQSWPSFLVPALGLTQKCVFASVSTSEWRPSLRQYASQVNPIVILTTDDATRVSYLHITLPVSGNTRRYAALCVTMRHWRQQGAVFYEILRQSASEYGEDTRLP